MINLKQLFISLGFLALVMVAALFGAAILTVLTLGFAGSLAKLLANVVFWGTMVIMLTFAVGKPEKTGIFWAPIIFCGLWFTIACVTRIVPYFYHETTITPTIAQQASKQQTLIIFSQHRRKNVEKLLVTNHIKSLARLQKNKSKNPTGELTTVGSNKQCEKASQKNREFFKQAGYQNRCFLRTKLDTFPDGLVIRKKSRKRGSNCCDNVIITIRHDGSEQEIVKLRRGTSPILTFFPKAIKIIRWTTYGTAKIELSDTIKALYTFDIRKPIIKNSIPNN